MSDLCVIVALPGADDPVHDMGPEQSHVTLAFLGQADTVDPGPINDAVAAVAAQHQPGFSNVAGRGVLGSDDAEVLFLDGEHLAQIRDALLADPAVAAAHSAAQQFPTWNPHLTLGYPADGPTDPLTPANIQFDRLAVWHAGAQTEHPMGADMTAPSESSDATAPPPEIGPIAPIPWHGVLVTEGSNSGDGRKFTNKTLRNRPLPLPLTWQEASGEGHNGSVKIGRIDRMTRVPLDENTSEIRAHGLMMQDPRADTVVGEMAFFGRIGVSVDVDDIVMEFVDTGSPMGPDMEFTEGRVSSACAVIIPAFAEAWLALGEPPEGFYPDDAQPTETVADAPDAVAYSGSIIETFGRGPGWVTEPKPTARIHDYWTVPGQPGYEKIAWGTGGDFDRCRTEVGKHLAASGEPQFINQTCAQWHHDALGIWPSTHAKELKGLSLDDTRAPSPINLVASTIEAKWLPPGEWFAYPEFTELTPLTLTEHAEGWRVFGHCAGWDQCHTGFGGVCIAPIDSPTNFAYFNTNARLTTNGVIYTGCISLGAGHPDTKLSARAALATYDDTTTTVADVHMGRDDFGIWFSGWVRPSAYEDQDKFAQLMGCRISPDWRQGELRHLLGVNEGGFQIAKSSVYVHDGQQETLVASSGIIDAEPVVVRRSAELGVNDLIAAEVAKALAEERAGIERAAKLHEVKERVGAELASHMDSLRAKHQED